MSNRNSLQTLWQGTALALLVVLAFWLSGPVGGPAPRGSEAAYLDEARKLVASDPGGGDGFGFSVAASGDTAIVGSYLANSAGNDAGAAYIYQRDQGGTSNWGQVKKLTANDAAAGDLFGVSVSISGDIAAVGASGEDDGGFESGAVYIFLRNQGGPNNWGQVKKIVPADAVEFNSFGTSVSLEADTLLVGALGESSIAPFGGAAYVFLQNLGGGNNWGEVKKVTASDAEENDFFGTSVSLDGQTAVVGSVGEDTGGEDAGAAYVFMRDQGGGLNWGEVKKLTAADPESFDNFGVSVAIDANTIVSGALGEDTGAGEAGAAYIYDRDLGGANNWGQVKKLAASDPDEDDGFGASVSVSGAAVLVGATVGDAGGANEGSAYVFQRDAGGTSNWGEVKELNASDAQSDDAFGSAVSLSTETAVLGAPGEDAGGGDAGAAYVFGETDTDGDTVKDLTDNCPTTANPGQQNAVHPATFPGDHCENPDSDGLMDFTDGCPDDANNDGDADGYCNGPSFQPPETGANDNCPNKPNPTQALPTWSVPVGDTDCDGFPDTVTVTGRGRENFIGTDATDHCADTTTPNDETAPGVSPWPPDFNDNRLTNLSDVVAIGPSFNTPGPARFNLNAVGGINLADVVAIGPFFNKNCATS